MRKYYLLGAGIICLFGTLFVMPVVASLALYPIDENGNPIGGAQPGFEPFNPAPAPLPPSISEWPHQLWIVLTSAFLVICWMFRKRIEKSRVGKMFNYYWLGEGHFSKHSVVWGILLVGIVLIVFDFVSHSTYSTINNLFGYDVYQGLTVFASSLLGVFFLFLWFNIGKNMGRSNHPVIWSVIAPLLHLLPLVLVFIYLYTYVTFGGVPYIDGFFDDLFLIPKVMPLAISLGLFIHYTAGTKKTQGFLEKLSQKIPFTILILVGLYTLFSIYNELFVSSLWIIY